MTEEADLLNEMHDLKEKRHSNRNKLRNRNKRKERIGYPGIEDRREVYQLEQDIKSAGERIDRIRKSLWKGIGGEIRYAPMYSSALCRTGKVPLRHK